MKTFPILVIALLLPTVLVGQTTHLDTLRHLNVQAGGSYSALWGYTAPDGREYALLGVNGGSGRPGGTSIVDITDENNVVQVAFIGGPNSSWREMKTYGHYAYVVTEAGGGVQIIDLSELPDTARLVRSFNYTSGSNNISRSHSVSLHDGFLYLNGCAGWSGSGIVIFDLREDPTNPVFAGQFQPEYIHDCYVLRDTIYASAVYSGGGLHIADARDKANIQPIGKITYAGSGTHNSWVTRDRRYVITTDEIGTTPKTLKIWDISSLPSMPAAPTNTFTPTPPDIEHNITIRGDYAYVAWYTAGVRVVDLSDPANPVDAGGYDTSPVTPGNYAGVWGVYPYFPSGKIIGGDMQNGLWVFRFSDLAPRTRARLLEPVDHDTVTSTDALTFRWTRSADMARDPHWYTVHVWGTEYDTTFLATDTSATFSHVTALQPGLAYSWTVATTDEWNNTASQDTFSLVRTIPTGVSPERVPLAFSLGQNYPNPFNPVTTIEYELPSPAEVELRVFNVLGELVAEPVHGVHSAGRHRTTFDASAMASGMYVYRLTAAGLSVSRKMLVTK